MESDWDDESIRGRAIGSAECAGRGRRRTDRLADVVGSLL